jgi:hypothetical protein
VLSGEGDERGSGVQISRSPSGAGSSSSAARSLSSCERKDDGRDESEDTEEMELGVVDRDPSLLRVRIGESASSS